MLFADREEDARPFDEARDPRDVALEDGPLELPRDEDALLLLLPDFEDDEDLPRDEEVARVVEELRLADALRLAVPAFPDD